LQKNLKLLKEISEGSANETATSEIKRKTIEESSRIDSCADQQQSSTTATKKFKIIAEESI
jgi:hypothetical protein